MPVLLSEFRDLTQSVNRLVIELPLLRDALNRLIKKVDGDGDPGYGEQLRSLDRDLDELEKNLAAVQHAQREHSSLDRRVDDLEKKLATLQGAQKEHSTAQWTFRTELVKSVSGFASGAVAAAVVKWLLG